MPNWCMNRLNITGPASERKRFKREAESDWECPNDQTPKKLNFYALIKLGHPKIKDEDIRKNMWAFDERVSEDKDKGQLIYDFDSKWDVPALALCRISKAFPKLRFVVKYDEPGMCFKGRIRIEEGNVIRHTRTQY